MKLNFYNQCFFFFFEKWVKKISARLMLFVKILFYKTYMKKTIIKIFFINAVFFIFLFIYLITCIYNLVSY